MRHRKSFVWLIALALALCLCPAAFAAGGDFTPATGSEKNALEVSASSGMQYFSNCMVVAKTRVRVGAKNMNPVKSVKSPSGKVLREGKGYRIDYYRTDMYGDLTKRTKKAPTKPGRYIAMLYPIDTKAYYGMYAVYYQVTPKGFVEHAFTEAQKAALTPYVDTDSGYRSVYDSQTPWNHYVKPGSKSYKAYIANGLRDYPANFDDSSVWFFLQDPNDGSYIISRSENTLNMAYTQVGLTYNMPLCVSVAEASYSLNKLADTVSDKSGRDVSAKKTWVSSKSYKALKSAIANAEKVGTKKGASKSKVKAAAKQLDKALKGFKPKPGKKGKKRNLKKAKVENVVTSAYRGAPIRQYPIVMLGKEKLIAGKHYTVSYTFGKKAVKAGGMKAVGTYRAIITGKGTCTGKTSKPFKIKKASVKMYPIYVDYIPTQTLKKAGKPVKPKVTVRAYWTYPSVTLKQGRDYTVSYKNNTKVGTAKAIITGKGNLTGKRIVTFNIE